KVYGMAAAKGAIVTSVTPRENDQPTPAAKAGLQPNDIIVEYQGVPVLSAQDLIQKVAGTGVGDSATIVFLRDVDGKLEKHTVEVMLSERPKLSLTGATDDSPKAAPRDSTPRGNGLHLGITLAELTPQLANEKHLNGVKGLYIKEIDPSGLVAEVRNPVTGQPALNEGEVITRINRVPLSSLADFQRVLSTLKPGDPIVLNVAAVQRDAKGERPLSRIVQFTYQ
ncbi:MAG TPA: PDZ domain-containing protein, partial [Pyrinomonadaceae bacterium]